MTYVHPSPDLKSQSVDSRDRFLVVYEHEHEGRTVALEGWPTENKAREMALFLNQHEGRERFTVVPRPDYFKTTGA